jgi:hypothetical protein
MAMLADIETRFQVCCEDPRSTPGFPEGAYPVERGWEGVLPEGVAEAKVRFLAVYARRNACVLALADLDAAEPSRRALMERFLFLTEAIDHLEDIYAPIGFLAEPVLEGGMFARELVFTHVRVGSARSEPSESSFSFFIPIPPEGERGGRGGDGT